MANHKSAIKRHRQSLKRRDANRSAKAEVRTALKKASAVSASGKKDEALKATRQAESLMSKASKKGLFHKKTLARKISRLAKQANKAAK
jgi:small subunit ribosomal protein S20